MPPLLSVLALLGGPAVPPAAAAQPLVAAYDLAAAELAVWWRPGDLMLVTPGTKGLEARRPLVDGDIHPAPATMGGWTRLDGACDPVDAVQVTFPLAGKSAVATVGGDAALPAVHVLREGVLVAQAPLGQPARPCAIHVGEADGVPGLELVVTWSLGSLHGVTVLRLPELAQ